MTRDQVLALLHEALPGLRQRYGVKELAIFGSVARNEAGPDSDVDVLVEYEGRPTLDSYMGLKFELEDLLGRPVDLATPTALKPRIRLKVINEAVRVA